MCKQFKYSAFGLIKIYTFNRNKLTSLLNYENFETVNSIILKQEQFFCINLTDQLTLLWSECLNQPEPFSWPEQLNTPEYRHTFKPCTLKQCHSMMIIYFGSPVLLVMTIMHAVMPVNIFSANKIKFQHLLQG